MKKLLVSLLVFTVAASVLAAPKSVTLAVKGWTCGSCAASTRIALKKLDGIEDVKTDHETREAVVTYDDAKVTPERMIQAVERLGYKATVKAGVAPPPVSSPRSEKSAQKDAAANMRRSHSPERLGTAGRRRSCYLS